MASALAIFHRISLEVQKRGITLSDCYGYWLMMQIALNETVASTPITNLAKYLLDAMKNRHSSIFDNPAMVAAIFLDPRFHDEIKIDENRTRLAKLQIGNVWQRIQTIAKFNQTEHEVHAVEAQSTSKHELPNLNDLFAKLDQYLEKRGSTSAPSSHLFLNRSEPDLSRDKSDILLILDSFNPTRLKPNEKVIEYWQNIKNTPNSLQEIAEIAQTLNSIPPDETENERDFSKLAFILSDLRTLLDSDTLENILLINLNKSLFNMV